MTNLSPIATLHGAWQQLRQVQPGVRAREAARLLDVSEAELVACRLGKEVVRLRPLWKPLLGALEALGEVMALTRNEHCVHERHGHYRELSVAANGRMGLVVSPDIDLRLFLSDWTHVFALGETSPRGGQHSLQMFDAQGVAVHKVYLTEHSDQAAWEALKAQFRDDDQSSPVITQPTGTRAAPKPDAAIDRDALQAGWTALKDTHHFHALLQNLGASRTQALRLAGSEWANPLPTAALPRVLERAAASELPIMVFVGNRHCLQIHTGTVSHLAWRDSWFNVLDPRFSLHLQTAGVAELWRVRKPSVDGVVTSLEAYDASGELVVQLFGARKPGQPERADWRTLVESAQ